MDCGLIQEKARDSLAKFPGRTGTKGSGSSDRDRTARIITVQDLIRRSGLIGARVGGEARRRQSSSGGMLPELAKLGPLGWDSSGKRASEARCCTHNPPRVTAGLAGARSSGQSCGGGSAASGSPASVFARSSGHGNWAKGRVRMRSARVTRNRVSAVLCRAAGAWPRWSMAARAAGA